VRGVCGGARALARLRAQPQGPDASAGGEAGGRVAPDGGHWRAAAGRAGCLEDLAFRPVPARLAALLLRLRQSHGHIIDGVSHQELGAPAGTLRETTTQTLDEFKAAGWVETGRRRIIIRDAASLQAVADTTRQRPGARP